MTEIVYDNPTPDPEIKDTGDVILLTYVIICTLMVVNVVTIALIQYSRRKF